MNAIKEFAVPMVRKRHRREFTLVFEIKTAPLPDERPVYITGNHRELGNWEPGMIAMEQESPGVWKGEFSFRKNTQLQYKFTRGSWDTEAVNERGKPFFNHHMKVVRDQRIRIDIPHWKDTFPGNGQPGEGKPEDRITGAVRFHRQMEGEGLLPRDIVVWLPPGYKTRKNKRYPVLYMHDGQNIFDPVTAYAGVDWEADETATRLIKQKKMRDIIIVGIYNTKDRDQEYSLCPRGRLYMHFIVERLKPFIDRTYRTLPGREHTAIMGSSLGGLISFLLIWQYPRVFSLAGCLSPSFVYRREQAIKFLKKSPAPDEPVRILMDCGGRGGERLLYRGCKKVLRILRRKGISPGKDFQFYYDAKADHSESAWAARLWRHFQFLFPPAE